MASASHGFRKRVQDRVKQEARPVVKFFLETVTEGEDGEEIVVRHDDFTATQPSEDQLLLVFAEGGNENATGADQTKSILDIFKASLPANQYRTLIRRLKDPQDVDVTWETMNEIFTFLMGEWATFPTKSLPASSTSPQETGARSTGRVRGEGSIS